MKSPFESEYNHDDISKFMELRNMKHKTAEEVIKEREEQAEQNRLALVGKSEKQLKEKWKDVFSLPTIYGSDREGCLFGSDYQ